MKDVAPFLRLSLIGQQQMISFLNYYVFYYYFVNETTDCLVCKTSESERDQHNLYNVL